MGGHGVIRRQVRASLTATGAKGENGMFQRESQGDVAIDRVSGLQKREEVRRKPRFTEWENGRALGGVASGPF